jgi:4-hydroxy-tetrahydrodipicolinate synthase
MTFAMTFEGIYTPVITPYTEDGEIDRDAFVAMIEHLVAAGVHGLINGGSTGENYTQTVDERVELARFTPDRIAGRVPLIVGTGRCGSRLHRARQHAARSGRTRSCSARRPMPCPPNGRTR